MDTAVFDTRTRKHCNTPADNRFSCFCWQRKQGAFFEGVVGKIAEAAGNEEDCDDDQEDGKTPDSPGPPPIPTEVPPRMVCPCPLAWDHPEEVRPRFLVFFSLVTHRKDGFVPSRVSSSSSSSSSISISTKDNNNKPVREAVRQVERVLVILGLHHERQGPERLLACSRKLVLEIARVSSRSVPPHAFSLSPRLDVQQQGVSSAETEMLLTISNKISRQIA